MRNWSQPPNPRSLTHGAHGLAACEFGPHAMVNQRTAWRQKPLWRSTPLRLLSRRAVSCGLLPMIACKAPVTSQLHDQEIEIRFCSVSLSGFKPSLSGFVPTPTFNTEKGVSQPLCRGLGNIRADEMSSLPFVSTHRRSIRVRLRAEVAEHYERLGGGGVFVGDSGFRGVLRDEEFVLGKLVEAEQFRAIQA